MFLLTQSFQLYYGFNFERNKGYGEVIVPTLGWVSDISPVVNLGLKLFLLMFHLKPFPPILRKYYHW